MDKRTIAWAAGLMAAGVALGAFGAHALKARLGADALGQWHTGVDYHFLHALGMLAVGMLHDVLGRAAVRRMALLFLAGIMLFSGSLYLLATRDLLGTQALTPVLGPITPVGGLLFIAGWIHLLITALRRGPQR